MYGRNLNGSNGYRPGPELDQKYERNIVGREYNRILQVRMMNDEYSITTGLMDKMNIQSHIMERKLNFTDIMYFCLAPSSYRFLYQKSYINALNILYRHFQKPFLTK